MVNSAMPLLPAVQPVYAPIRSVLIDVSNWGLLIAISALGLATSLSTIARLGWRHAATVTATTLVILVAAALGLMVVR
jgi:uncharacterized membrane protein YadS